MTTTAEVLVSAHRRGESVNWTDAYLVSSLEEAMATQAEVIRRLDTRPAGWKVGFGPDATAVAAPILAEFLHTDGAALSLPAAGRVGLEVEIAFRLGQDLPARDRPYSKSEVLGAVSGALVGIELVASRFNDAGSLPYPVYLADNLGNAGYVAGESGAESTELELSSLPCRIWRDGELIHDRVGGHPQGDPLQPLLAYAGGQIDHCGGLRAGQVVTTGTLCGVITIDRPCTIAAEIAGIGTAWLSIVGR